MQCQANTYFYIQDFYGRLQEHVLERFSDPNLATDDCNYSDAERAQIIFRGERIYLHRNLRVNYTTYDVRRGQDSINTRNNPHIMTLVRKWDVSSDIHPFSYARVLGIFHVDFTFRPLDGTPATTQKMNVLWVQWYEFDSHFKAGFKRRRLYRVRPVSSDNNHAYGFLDPADVIRGTHLIPAFAHTKGSDLGVSAELPSTNSRGYFYVNMYATGFFSLISHANITL
jgi:hypothetical protein